MAVECHSEQTPPFLEQAAEGTPLEKYDSRTAIVVASSVAVAVSAVSSLCRQPREQTIHTSVVMFGNQHQPTYGSQAWGSRVSQPGQLPPEESNEQSRRREEASK